jgi:hypothetical protein
MFRVSQSFILAQNAKALRIANSTTLTHSDLTAVHCRNCSIEFAKPRRRRVQGLLSSRGEKYPDLFPDAPNSLLVFVREMARLISRKGGERQWEWKSYSIFRSSKFLVKKTYSETAPAAAKATVAMRTIKDWILNLTPFTPALPPDVRRGSAPAVSILTLGWAAPLVRALPQNLGPEAEPGA